MLKVVSALALLVASAAAMSMSVKAVTMGAGMNDQAVAPLDTPASGIDEGGMAEISHQFAAPTLDETEAAASRAAFFDFTTDADAALDDIDHATRRLLLVGMLALVCFTAWLAFRRRTRPIALDRVCVGASAALAPALFMTLGPAVGCLSIMLTLVSLAVSRRLPLGVLSAASHVVLLLVVATKLT